ncbi:MAG TPA: zinc ribbon domain-containing protein [Chloroflexota bacterium]|nr:zinc ribbon domain-containing protein [Chloroflexota bacterium]
MSEQPPRCPTCGADAPAGSRFCTACGAPLREQAAPPQPRRTLSGRVLLPLGCGILGASCCLVTVSLTLVLAALTPPQPAPPPGPAPPIPASTEGRIRVTFAKDVDPQCDPTDPTATFSTADRRVAFILTWPSGAIPAGATFDAVLYGRVQGQTTRLWEARVTPNPQRTTLCGQLTLREPGLPPGLYELQVSLNGALVGSGRFTVQ